MAEAFYPQDALDALLDKIKEGADTLVICSQLPATYAEAYTTYKLGTKASPTLGANVADGTGRKFVISAITASDPGTVSVAGTATNWALIDTTGDGKLCGSGPLSASQAVAAGNVFTLGAIDVKAPQATA